MMSIVSYNIARSDEQSRRNHISVTADAVRQRLIRAQLRIELVASATVRHSMYIPHG